MDATQKVRMMHKFEICYVIAREGLAFLKYPALHALAERSWGPPIREMTVLVFLSTI